jgi:hypothetical protein
MHGHMNVKLKFATLFTDVSEKPAATTVILLI